MSPVQYVTELSPNQQPTTKLGRTYFQFKSSDKIQGWPLLAEVRHIRADPFKNDEVVSTQF